MQKEAIYHSSSSRYLYAYDNETIHIRLRTKKGDADEIKLRWGDPFEWEEDEKGNWTWELYETVKMEKQGSSSLFDFWVAALKPPYKRVKYAFEIHSGSESIVYAEKGFFKSDEKNDSSAYFTFPYLNEEDVFSPPEWVKETVWYQIFPERFANGNPSLDPEGTLPWGSKDPERDSFFGGDLEGIIQHIDYLKDLGITGVYMTPVFKAPTNHKYDTIDYMEIDPHFGDKETFRKLVETCHSNGIKVMIDAVFNHAGYHFPPFQDVLEKGEASKYKDWFHMKEFPLKTEPKPNYATFAFEKTMPKLNTSNPELKAYLIETGKYWVKEFDVDGWRLDVANEVPHTFWREFRKEVKAIKPDVYILGEIWHEASEWLLGDQFDAVMNYPYTDAALRYFGKEEITAEEFIDKTVSAVYMYPDNVTEVSFNLLGSHDTPRILTECGGNKDKVKQLMAFLLSAPGTPCIYYGDEIGLSGDMDPGCRKCMVWDEEQRDLDMLAFTKKLISLRKAMPVFGNHGHLTFLDQYIGQDIIAYTKEYGEEKLLFLFSNSKGAELHLDESLQGGTFKELISGRDISGSEGIVIKPNEVLILKR